MYKLHFDKRNRFVKVYGSSLIQVIYSRLGMTLLIFITISACFLFGQIVLNTVYAQCESLKLTNTTLILYLLYSNNYAGDDSLQDIGHVLNEDYNRHPENELMSTGNTSVQNSSCRLINESQPFGLTISATDSNADMLTYSAYNLPDGASFDPDTRTFSWTPRYDQAGVYVVRFEVSDGMFTDFEDVTITVIQLYEDWDVNGDEAANVLDMILVGQHWDETGLTGWILEDVNEDGGINVLDLIVIGQNWTG